MPTPLNLIILGPQGSGKGTQAKLLAERFGYLVFGAGDLLREIAKIDIELGREVNQIINKRGELVPPKVIAKVISEKLASQSPEQPVIIDSFPRTVEQYRLFREFWPKLNRGAVEVVYIELTDEEAIKRLSKRFICALCGENYIGKRAQCDKCGGRLIQREDDMPEKVKKRLSWTKSELNPMLKAMQADGFTVIRINGAPPIEEVHREIVSKLGL